MANISKTVKFPPRQRGDITVKTAAFTLKDEYSGQTFVWNSTTAFNFNLPPVAKSSKGVFFNFIIRTAATSGTGHGISPSTLDKIYGATASAVANKDVYFATAADAISNGFVAISDGDTGWQLVNVSGTLSQEA